MPQQTSIYRVATLDRLILLLQHFDSYRARAGVSLVSITRAGSDYVVETDVAIPDDQSAHLEITRTR